MSLIIVLAGCVSPPQNKKIHPLSVSKPSKVVIAQLSGLENPGFYTIGNQGLLDILLNEALTSSAREKVEKINAQETVEKYYFKIFEKTFLNKSFKVEKIPAILDKKDLSLHPVREDKYANYDFKWLKDKYGAEYALVLHPNVLGVERQYHGFIPMGAPYGIANISVYLVKLEDNSLEGAYYSYEQVPVNGEWDDAPEFRALTESSKKALEKALRRARNYLFSNIPELAPVDVNE